MRDFVAIRVLEPLVQVAEIREIEEALLIDGLSFSHEDCKKGLYGRLAWAEFILYLQRLDDALEGEMVQIVGESFGADNPFSNFLRLGGLFFSPKLYFWMANNCFAPLMFPVMSLEVEEVSRTGIRIEASIPEELEDCPLFFELSAELMRRGPTTLGMRPAHVELTTSPHRAVMEVNFPPNLSLFARGRRIVDVALSAQSFMDEVLRQHESLQKSYEALMASEKSFQMLVERLPEGVLIVDGPKILYANEVLAKMLGYKNGRTLAVLPLEKIIGSTEVFHTESGEDNLLSLTLQGRGSREVRVEASRFETVFLGQEVLIFVMRDTTLRDEVLARALDMDRLITRGTLAAGIAHEINNPMTFVVGNLSLLEEEILELVGQCEERLDGKRVQQLLEALNSCRRGIDQAIRIARDLKSIGQDRAEELEVADLRDAVNGALRWARPELVARAGLRLELQECGQVRTNLPRVNQVVLNLLLNSLHAFDERDPSQNEIIVRTFLEKGNSVVEVCDNGQGIPEELRSKVFEPFFTTRSDGKGTGLGLFISRNIVERLDGELILESAEGEGTCVRVAFPVVETVREEQSIAN